jgi:DNA-binding CsgD family transcriptional regulator
MPGAGHHRLIADIYGSIGDAGAMPAAMQSTAASIGATAAFWYVMPPRAPLANTRKPFVFNDHFGFPTDGMRVFETEMWRHDYALKYASIPDRTTETHELISDKEAARNDFIRFVAGFAGVDRRIGRSTRLSNGTVAGWAFHLPAGLARRPAERTCFDALAPHLRQMFRLSALLGEADARGDALEAVMNARDEAILLLDADGSIRWRSDAAGRLSADKDGLDCTGDRLAFARAPERQQFDTMLAGKAMGANRMLVPRPSGRRAYVLQLAPASDEMRRQLHTRCAYIVTVRDPDHQPTGRPDLWRMLFGLTATEARVAESSMRGLDDATIATRLGIGIGTVRSHQRHILAKTDTRSKAELAHLLTRLG